jgi:hypothetical protein
MDGGLCRGPWCRTVVMWNKSLAQMNKTQGGGQSNQGAFGATRCRAGKGRILTSIRSANLPRP